MRRPWRKLNSKIIHKNPWYYLREDDVIRPDGERGKYFYVDGINSVAVIAEDRDKKIYLVGQTRYPLGNYFSWEIITGGIVPKDSALKNAKRELKEEAGIMAKTWVNLGYCYPINGYSSEKCHIFLAKNLVKTNTNHEGTEDIKIKKESLKNILNMIKLNEITCGITVFSIYKYLLFKK